MHMSRKAPPKSTTLHSNLPSYYRNPASAGARPETAANDNCRVMASGPGSRSGCATTRPASARTPPPPPRGEQDPAAIDSEQVDEPRASSARSPPDRRFTCRHRGIRASLVSSSMPRSVGMAGSAPPGTSA